MQITATEAKNRFGQILDACQTEPVFVAKSGRPHGVMLSFAAYEQLQQQARKAPSARAKSSAGQQFYAANQAWVDQQNALVDELGVWSDGLLEPAPLAAGGKAS